MAVMGMAMEDLEVVEEEVEDSVVVVEDVVAEEEAVEVEEEDSVVDVEDAKGIY